MTPLVLSGTPQIEGVEPVTAHVLPGQRRSKCVHIYNLAVKAKLTA